MYICIYVYILFLFYYIKYILNVCYIFIKNKILNKKYYTIL